MTNYKKFNNTVSYDVLHYPIINTSYNSLAEYIDVLKQFKTDNPDHNSFIVNDNFDSFYGGSMDMAFNVDNSMLIFSLADFSESARDVAEKLKDKFSDSQYFKDVTGDSFDVAEVLSGRPECWDRMEEQKNKKLDIVFNTGFHCKIKHIQVLNKGACLLGIVDALKAANVSLSLKTVDYSFIKGHYKKYTKNTINIDLEMISPDTLRFICCNPLFHRRLALYEREILMHTENLSSCKYGFPQTYIPEKENIENDTLVFSGSFTPYTLEDGIRQVKKALESFTFDDGAPQLIII